MSKLKTMCKAVKYDGGDFAETMRLRIEDMFERMSDLGGTYVDIKISRISGASENTMLMITLIYKV